MDYDQIINLALSYSDRTDSDITQRMSDFVTVVEARINRSLRTQDMSVRSVINMIADQEYYGLPESFAGIRDIEVREDSSTRGRTASYLSPEQMNNAVDMGSIYYTIVANQIQIFPAQSDKVLEIVYYQRVAPLTTDNPVNWLSERQPDAYLYGLLVEIESFVKNPTAAEMWNSRFLTALGEVIREDDIDRWSGTPLTIKVG